MDLDVYVGAFAHVYNIHYAWTIYKYYDMYSFRCTVIFMWIYIYICI